MLQEQPNNTKQTFLTFIYKERNNILLKSIQNLISVISHLDQVEPSQLQPMKQQLINTLQYHNFNSLKSYPKLLSIMTQRIYEVSLWLYAYYILINKQQLLTILQILLAINQTLKKQLAHKYYSVLLKIKLKNYGYSKQLMEKLGEEKNKIKEGKIIRGEEIMGELLREQQVRYMKVGGKVFKCKVIQKADQQQFNSSKIIQSQPKQQIKSNKVIQSYSKIIPTQPKQLSKSNKAIPEQSKSNKVIPTQPKQQSNSNKVILSQPNQQFKSNKAIPEQFKCNMVNPSQQNQQSKSDKVIPKPSQSNKVIPIQPIMSTNKKQQNIPSPSSMLINNSTKIFSLQKIKPITNKQSQQLSFQQLLRQRKTRIKQYLFYMNKYNLFNIPKENIQEITTVLINYLNLFFNDIIQDILMYSKMINNNMNSQCIGDQFRYFSHQGYIHNQVYRKRVDRLPQYSINNNNNKYRLYQLTYPSKLQNYYNNVKLQQYKIQKEYQKELQQQNRYQKAIRVYNTARNRIQKIQWSNYNRKSDRNGVINYLFSNQKQQDEQMQENMKRKVDKLPLRNKNRLIVQGKVVKAVLLKKKDKYGGIHAVDMCFYNS